MTSLPAGYVKNKTLILLNESAQFSEIPSGIDRPHNLRRFHFHCLIAFSSHPISSSFLVSYFLSSFSSSCCLWDPKNKRENVKITTNEFVGIQRLTLGVCLSPGGSNFLFLPCIFFLLKESPLDSQSCSSSLEYRSAITGGSEGALIAYEEQYN
jgi:hypothetical protein